MDFSLAFVELAKNHPYVLFAVLLVFYGPYVVWEMFKWVSARIYWQNKAFEHMAGYAETQRACLQSMENISKSQEKVALATEKMCESFNSTARVVESILSKIDLKIDEECANYAAKERHQ